jgi:hypothetical protein
MLTQQEFIDLTYTVWLAKQADAFRTTGFVGSTHYVPSADREALIQYIIANPADPHVAQYEYSGGELRLSLYGLQATQRVVPPKPLLSVRNAPSTLILPI